MTSKYGGEVAYQRHKITEKFNLPVLKVVAVAYKGFDYDDFTAQILVFWKNGYLREVVASGGSTVLLSLIINKCALQMKNAKFKRRCHSKFNF